MRTKISKRDSERGLSDASEHFNCMYTCKPSLGSAEMNFIISNRYFCVPRILF